MAEKGNAMWATGRRKEASARVRLKEGEGSFEVNGRPIEEYFGGRKSIVASVKRPFELTQTLGKFDCFANLRGGGVNGQADALKLGIARALAELDESLRSLLRREGYLSRDPREKERKKYGQKGARARFQFSKR